MKKGAFSRVHSRSLKTPRLPGGMPCTPRAPRGSHTGIGKNNLFIEYTGTCIDLETFHQRTPTATASTTNHQSPITMLQIPWQRAVSVLLSELKRPRHHRRLPGWPLASPVPSPRRCHRVKAPPTPWHVQGDEWLDISLREKCILVSIENSWMGCEN